MAVFSDLTTVCTTKLNVLFLQLTLLKCVLVSDLLQLFNYMYILYKGIICAAHF